jgi:hypothetical protein
MEVGYIDKKKALTLLSVVALAAIISGIALNAYSPAQTTVNAETTPVTTQPTANVQTTPNTMQCWCGSGWPAGNMSMRMRGVPYGMRGRGCFGYGFIEVSEEFKENVINIAKNDADVQNLLNEGYNITAVKPIVKTIVEGDGTVVTKATSAVLILEKDTTGRAFVWVDLEQGKVTRIEVLTRTVIEKP